MPESLDAPPLLSTARLRLRKPELKDADPIFVSYASDPEVVRFRGSNPVRDEMTVRRANWRRGKSLAANQDSGQNQTGSHPRSFRPSAKDEATAGSPVTSESARIPSSMS